MLKRRLPSELIFFVTSRCNLRCRHCFNWQNLQRGEDLTLDEIESLAKSLPGLRTLMMSGGEPFLRKDIVDICRIFARHCRLKLIEIPTAGSLVELTIRSVEEILKIEPQFRLAIGISIDGMESYHDANRGVPGTFARAVECCSRLLELKKKSQRLQVDILTTLVGDNRDELLAVKNFVAEKMPLIDNLHWAVARGDARAGNAGSVTRDDLALIDREFLEFNDRGKPAPRRAIHGRFYELRREVLEKNEQPVPCVAGSKIAVVYDNGGIAPCELLPPVGNLRDMTFEAIWNSKGMKDARKGILSEQCSCTHECFLQPSYRSYLKKSPFTLMQTVGLGGLMQLLGDKYAETAAERRGQKPAEVQRRKR